MAEHCRARAGALRPVAAGPVLGGREGRPVRLRAGERVMHVRRIATAVDDRALLGQRGLLGEFVIVAVQIVDAGRDHHAFGVLPWSAADAVARIHRRRAAGGLGAEISAPVAAAGAHGLRQVLTVLVGAREAAQVRAFAAAHAGDEERHVGRLLRLHAGAGGHQRKRRAGKCRNFHCGSHGLFLLFRFNRFRSVFCKPNNWLWLSKARSCPGANDDPWCP